MTSVIQQVSLPGINCINVTEMTFWRYVLYVITVRGVIKYGTEEIKR